MMFVPKAEYFKDQESENGHAKAIVDIVIPVYGQAKLLERCIESVLATTINPHLIIVDDCSPGTDIARLFNRLDQKTGLTLIRSKNNLGFIGCCRLGAEAGRASFILFLNSDTEAIEPGWLDRMLPKEDDIAITGAKLVFPSDMPGKLAGKIQHAGVYRNGMGGPDHAFYGQSADLIYANRSHDVNAVTGACLLIRRSVWDELKGFDLVFGRGIYGEPGRKVIVFGMKLPQN
jgi:GT2 family glycosyltransferase